MRGGTWVCWGAGLAMCECFSDARRPIATAFRRLTLLSLKARAGAWVRWRCA